MVAACDLSSDTNAFKNWTFGKLLESNKLNIPGPRILPSDEGLFTPFVVLGDEAFALSEHVLRPYPNKKLRVWNIYIHIYIYITTGCQEHEVQSNAPLEFWLINGKYSTDQLMQTLTFVTKSLKLVAFYTIIYGKRTEFSPMTLCMNVPWKV